MLRALIFLLGISLAVLPAQAAIHGSSGVAPPTGCTKASAVDLAGTLTDCQNATQNPSFLWTAFFDTEANGGVRGSGQAAYALNDTTLTYDIACVDIGCGYNTVTMTDDPANVSFSASTGTITAGSLTVSDANLDATNGNIAANQTLAATGLSQTVKTVSLTSHNAGVQVWLLDTNVTVAGTPAITGSRYPQIGCVYNTSRSGISSSPIVFCQTTADTTTATTIQHYDFSLHSGTWLRISSSGTGVAGDITVTDNNFNCNSAVGSLIGGVLTTTSTHFNLTITHNHFHGGYSTGCTTGGTVLSNSTTGIGGTGGASCSTTYNFDLEWNVFEDSASDNQAGIGTCTNITIANNVFRNFNLAGIAHGAVYANSLTGAMGNYTYKHNICVYGSNALATLGTVCYSFLASAAVYTSTSMASASMLGNIGITNCAGGAGNAPCHVSNYTAQTALWQFVDPPYVSGLVSAGNLTDATGSLGGAVYHGGLSRNTDTCSQAANVAANNTTITCTSKSDVWFANSIVHVNSTPGIANGTIVYNGDGATGTLTLDGAGVNLGTGGGGIAGVLVQPGTLVSAKTSNTSYTVKNYYCSYTSSCTAAQLTAPHQSMYSACYILPMGTVNPVTGLASTGTGKNAGTYMSACIQSDTARITYHHYNPTIGSYAPNVNAGNDYNMLTGSGTYLGSVDWGSGIAP